MHRTRYSQFVFRNNTVCSGKRRGFPVIYRQSDEARQTKPPIISFPLISPLSWAIVQPAAGPLSRRQIGWQKRNGVIRRSAFGVIGDGKRSAVPLVQWHGVQRRRQLKGQQDAVVGKLDMQRRKAAIDRAGAFCAARAGVVRYIRYLRIGIDRKRGDIKEADPPPIRQRFFSGFHGAYLPVHAGKLRQLCKDTVCRFLYLSCLPGCRIAASAELEGKVMVRFFVIQRIHIDRDTPPGAGRGRVRTEISVGKPELIGNTVGLRRRPDSAFCVLVVEFRSDGIQIMGKREKHP